MKNLIRFLTLLFFVFLTPMLMLAQTGDPPPVSGFGIEEYFVTLTAFAGLVLMATEFVKRALNLNGTFTKIAAHILAVFLGAVAWLSNWGIFSEVTWWFGLLYALGAGLIANGFASQNTVEGILQLILRFFTKITSK